MTLDDYKVVRYRNQPEGWVAEVLEIQGCYALMKTREEALAELEQVFEMIAAEFRDKGFAMPSGPQTAAERSRLCYAVQSSLMGP